MDMSDVKRDGNAGVRVLVVGMGNVLHQDDGFGSEVARRLLDGVLPPGTSVIDAGIAGVRVVQELMDGYDGVIFVDATERGGVPGTLYELEPDVSGTLTAADAPDSLHMVEPSRIMALGRAAGCLPPRVVLVGCEPGGYDELEEGLTPLVAATVAAATELIIRRVQSWSEESQ